MGYMSTTMYTKAFLFLSCIQLMVGDIVVPPIEGDLDWWQNSIIYEIFPLSFKDSDGDGSGDFNGITQKLDYLVDIGITAIWLTPFLESPLKSSGYDISDYLKVQKVLGSIEDFKNLVYTAHEKNIKIIMDFVPNHTSDEHVWFKNSINSISKYTDYYVWKNAKNHDEVMTNKSVQPIVPNNWRRICDSDDPTAWTWDETRKQFYLSQFISNIPDLNFHNNDVDEEMKNILNYWLELGIDGIRIDALKHVYEDERMLDEPVIDPSRKLDYFNVEHIYTVDQDEVYDLLKKWRLILDEFKKKDNFSRIIMTESYSPRDVLFKYYTSGAEIPTNFNLMNHYRYTAKDYDRELKNWIINMPKGATFNVVLQNHDNKRVPTFYGTFLTDALNALSLFFPGVAIVYYGGEIGMEDISDKVNNARSPMQWDNTKNAGFSDGESTWVSVNSNYETKNVKTQNNDPKSNLNFFKSLARLRKTETFKRGGLATYILNETVFVLNRFLPENANYTLVINLDENNKQIRLSDQIPNLSKFLNVVIASKYSSFNPGDLASTTLLKLSPGATIILSDQSSPPLSTTTTSTIIESTTPESTIPSSSSQVYMTFKVLLFCVYFIKLCNYYYY